MELGTLIGLLVAFIGIIGGMLLEGGQIAQITQPTAALIVLGGTIGAVMVSFPLGTVIDAVKSLKLVVFKEKNDHEELIQELLRYAAKARRDGLLSLEQEAAKASDPFLGQALSLAVDGNDATTIRELCDLKIQHLEEHIEHVPKVYEAAGGYAPTVGIIGAVMGLIQVMQHLDNIEEVGHGIAVAFVATIYGVGFANIFFLPAGNKIKLAQRGQIVKKELILEGVLAIVGGLNSRLVEEKLRAFEAGHAHPKPEKK
jgi:chemotaxis protein MotA